MDLFFPVDQIKANEWISTDKSLPEKDGIYKVKLSDDKEIFAYFCEDKCYGLIRLNKPTHWWDKITGEPLDSVIKWGKE